MTLEEATELFNYDPSTGDLRWKKSVAKRVKSGDRAGCLNSTGYVHVIYKGKCYKLHRIAWLLRTGSFPKEFLDHVNGNKSDNRFENLREVDAKLNQQNRKSHRAGRLPGCWLHEKTGKWHARINHFGKCVSLKYHETEALAYAAYLNYARTHGVPILEKGAY